MNASRRGTSAAMVAPRPIITPTARGAVEHIDVGHGPVLLALHGAMGGADQSWLLGRALMRDMTGHRLIAVSRPGYLSTPLSLGASPEEQADLYVALLDALGIDRVTVAAVSAGGPSALHFALRYPHRCDGLILVSAATGRLPLTPQMLQRMERMGRMASVPGLGWLLGKLAGRDPSASARRSILDPVLLERTLAHLAAGPLIRALGASSMQQLARRMPGTLNDTRRYQSLPDFPFAALRVKLLVVHGTADRVVPFAHGEAAAAAPGAIFVQAQGGDHVALFTHLDEVRDAVARFMGR
ncbi:MAG: alpha/beta hydrolase [Hyphomicrobiales bacterium]|nr:MAG: alpha/beta hydrolase [Hyphomicrobiales bacterium]